MFQSVQMCVNVASALLPRRVALHIKNDSCRHIIARLLRRYDRRQCSENANIKHSCGAVHRVVAICVLNSLWFYDYE